KSLIKKRILMLQKQKSGQAAKWKYLLVVPLIVSMLAFVACSEETPIPAEKENTVAKPPAPPKPPIPPTKAYEDYIQFKKYMESKDVPVDWTFEEYKKFVEIVKERQVPEGTLQID